MREGGCVCVRACMCACMCVCMHGVWWVGVVVVDGGGGLHICLLQYTVCFVNLAFLHTALAQWESSSYLLTQLPCQGNGLILFSPLSSLYGEHTDVTGSQFDGHGLSVSYI